MKLDINPNRLTDKELRELYKRPRRNNVGLHEHQHDLYLSGEENLNTLRQIDDMIYQHKAARRKAPSISEYRTDRLGRRYRKTRRQIEADFQARWKKHLSRNMRRLMMEYIVGEVKLLARAANMPEAFIEGVVLRKIPNGPYVVGNIMKSKRTDADAPEWPLAPLFEKGTKRDYIIVPKRIRYAGDPRYADGPESLHWYRDGVHSFREIVEHPGQPARPVTNDGVSSGKPRLEAAIRAEYDRFRGRYASLRGRNAA